MFVESTNAFVGLPDVVGINSVPIVTDSNVVPAMVVKNSAVLIRLFDELVKGSNIVVENSNVAAEFSDDIVVGSEVGSVKFNEVDELSDISVFIVDIFDAIVVFDGLMVGVSKSWDVDSDAVVARFDDIVVNSDPIVVSPAVIVVCSRTVVVSSELVIISGTIVVNCEISDAG